MENARGVDVSFSTRMASLRRALKLRPEGGEAARHENREANREAGTAYEKALGQAQVGYI